MIRQIIANIGDKIYVIELQTDSSKFDDHVQAFHSMVASFQVLGENEQASTRTDSSSTDTGAPSSAELVPYRDPNGVYMLEHPSSWKVEYEEAVTRFDEPKTTFINRPGLGSAVTISLESGEENLDEDGRDLAFVESVQ